MLNLERQEKIMELLQKSGSNSVSALAKVLYVSQPTVRRDLENLEKQGLVLRTHGGVVLRKSSDSQVPLTLREDRNHQAKERIAEKAQELIRDGNVIFLDASSTASYLIPHLEKFKDLIVITNSPKTSMKLGERGIKNYCTGGLLLAHSIAYVGNEAAAFINNINADIFFFSSRGYTEEGNITDSSIEEAAIKRIMLKNATYSYYLADSSKKKKKYMYNICSLNDPDGIIDEN